MVIHIQTNHWLLPTNCSVVFHHFVETGLNGKNKHVPADKRHRSISRNKERNDTRKKRCCLCSEHNTTTAYILATLPPF